MGGYLFLSLIPNKWIMIQLLMQTGSGTVGGDLKKKFFKGVSAKKVLKFILRETDHFESFPV